MSRRDPDKVYHRTDRPGLKKVSPSFDWTTYFTAIGTPGVQAVDVSHLPFVGEISTMVKKVPASEWRSYLAWKAISGHVLSLPKPFADEAFAFDSKYLSGAKADLPRWKKCVAATDTALGSWPCPSSTRPRAEGKQVTQAMVGT